MPEDRPRPLSTDLNYKLELISQMRDSICQGTGTERLLFDVLQELLAQSGLQQRTTTTNLPVFEALTPREHEVLAGIVAGNSSKQIARSLGISHRTVEVHRRRLIGKVGAKNTADLVRMAAESASRQN